MKNLEKTFERSMELFREMRIKAAEEEYDKLERSPVDVEKFDALHERLLELLGENNKQLLFTYTDLLIAQYNVTPGFFYEKGFTECQSLFSIFRDILSGGKTINPLGEKVFADLEDE